MKIIEAIATIRAAIVASTAAETETGWDTAISDAGLTGGEDTGDTAIERKWTRDFGGVELRATYSWRDTSKHMSPGPDRTRLGLEVWQGSAMVDRYVGGWEK